MLKTTFLLFSFFSSVALIAQQWVPLEDFPGTARDDGTSFVIEDKAYCGTGLTPWWSELSDFHAFDMTTETWSTISSLPVGKERQYSTGFSNGINGFIFGGYDGTNFLNDLWLYDPNIDSWVEKSPLPDMGRSGSSCFVLNDTAYIVGGKTALLNAIDEVWAYDLLNDTWVQKTNMPFGSRWRASATSFFGQGYLLFGKDELNNFHNELFSYNPTNDSWETLPSHPEPGRSHAVLANIFNKLFTVFGVDDQGNSLNDFYEYNILLETWIPKLAFPNSERRGGISFVNDVDIFYTTGIDLNDVRLVETWKYTLSSSINETESSRLKVYPNPTSNSITIEVDFVEGTTITLFNILGDPVLEEESTNVINVANLKRGVYFLEVKQDNRSRTARFIKE